MFLVLVWTCRYPDSKESNIEESDNTHGLQSKVHYKQDKWQTTKYAVIAILLQYVCVWERGWEREREMVEPDSQTSRCQKSGTKVGASSLPAKHRTQSSFGNIIPSHEQVAWLCKSCNECVTLYSYFKSSIRGEQKQPLMVWLPKDWMLKGLCKKIFHFHIISSSHWTFKLNNDGTYRYTEGKRL